MYQGYKKSQSIITINGTASVEPYAKLHRFEGVQKVKRLVKDILFINHLDNRLHYDCIYCSTFIHYKHHDDRI